MKQHLTGKRPTKTPERPEYICSGYARFGKKACTSHYIKRHIIEDIVLSDIHSKFELIVDENKTKIEKCIAGLDNFIQNVYKDKVIGKISETVCVNLINKYQDEKERLQAESEKITERLAEVQQDEKDVDEFIKRLKKYAGADTFTREMALELIEYIIVDDIKKDSVKNRNREIHIYYKLLDDALVNKHNALE